LLSFNVRIIIPSTAGPQGANTINSFAGPRP
jgi:hypothetical protein